MCKEMGDTFVTNEMYVALDENTHQILLGGGNDKMLPFVRLDPTNAPKRIKSPITDKMHNVIHKRCRITVEVFND